MSISRALRVGSAIVLIVSVAVVLVPHIVSRISTAAVVNAPLLTVQSPFEGEIVTASPAAATALQPGDVFLQVTGSRLDRALVSELEARAVALASERRAAQAARDRLEALDARIAHRIDRLADLIRTRDEAEVASLDASVVVARARRDEAAARFRRSGALIATGSASTAQLEADEAAMIAAEGELAERLAERRMFDVERSAAAEEMSLDDSPGDLTYAQQRREDLVVRLAELDREIGRIAGEEEAVGRRLAEARATADRNERFVATSPTHGVVWRASASAGAPVAAGEPLVKVVDCDRRFVEVALDESAFGAVQPGDVAYVNYRGDSETFESRVSSVRGAGSVGGFAEFAAEPAAAPKDSLRVIVALDPSDVGDPAAAAAFCDVGRTAEVRFARRFDWPEAVAAWASRFVLPTPEEPAKLAAR